MRRGAGQLLAGLVTLSALAGCGFLDELAHPPPAAPAPLPSTASPTPTAQPPVTVLSTRLSHDAAVPGGPYRGTLEVGAHPVAAGLPPLGNRVAADCGLAADTARYLALDLTWTSGTHATTVVSTGVSVTGPAVDSDVLALLVESSASGVHHCQDGDRTAAVDHLVLGASGRVATVTAYLVTGAEAPADAFDGLTVELAELHDTVAGGSNVDTAWSVSGAPLSSCLEGPGAICVSVR